MKTIQIHPDDNVAVALEDLPGIPAGHKIALKDFKEGDQVIKYGFPIGHTIHAVSKGSLIDHHDIKTNLSGTLEYAYHPVNQPLTIKDEKLTHSEEAYAFSASAVEKALINRISAKAKIPAAVKPAGRPVDELKASLYKKLL